MRVRLREATSADVLAMFGALPPHRIRAIAAVIDEGAAERIIGIGGLGFRGDGTVIVFAEISDEMRRYPAAVQRAGRAGMALIRKSGVPLVVAEAQQDNPRAERWLRHFGFIPVELDGARGFVWRRENAEASLDAN